MNSLAKLGLAAVVCAGAHAQTGGYTQTTLVTNSKDKHLINPWGLSRPDTASAGEAYWWFSDQVKGVTTLSEANGSVLPLVITILSGTGSGVGSPAGATYLNKHFIFGTLDGTIASWFAGVKPKTPGTH